MNNSVLQVYTGKVLLSENVVMKSSVWDNML